MQNPNAGSSSTDYKYRSPALYTEGQPVSSIQQNSDPNPRHQLLRDLPQGEVERFNQLWQGEQASAKREALMQKHTSLQDELTQLGQVRSRLLEELAGIEAELAALGGEEPELSEA